MRILRPILALCLGLLLLEGASSLLLFALSLPSQVRQPLAERSHTRYDAELGWVNLPNVRRPDLYGPGAGLSTNAQGFRGGIDTPAEAPAGVARVVCSGDSFTLGYGVDDDDTWCALLGADATQVESVNMGQGGYGVGQSYLWYARDATFEHAVHLLAFIHEDFARLQADSFLGYGKPRLRLVDGELVATNVPVPRGGYLAPWLTQNRALLSQLRTVALVSAALGGADATPRDDAELRALVGALLDALDRSTRERGAEPALAYLPMQEDHRDTTSRDWRAFLRREAGRRGIRFVDLIPPFQSLPPERVAALFLAGGAFPAAAGHYSVAGNAWVAERLREQLGSLFAVVVD